MNREPRRPNLVLPLLLVLITAWPLRSGAETPTLCQFPDLDPKWVRQARALLDTVPVFDGHNALPWAVRDRFHGQLGSVHLSDNLRTPEEPLHTDIPRLRAGGVGAQFWSVYVPVSLEGPAAVQAVVEQIDIVHRMATFYPEDLDLALDADDVERIQAAGKIASLMGIEGGHSIGGSLAVLRQLYAIGARYMTLTHWRHNAWADAATSDPVHGGLTDFGRAVVGEMNRLGMLVDLSHVAETTMNDALDVTEAPVIFSHSSAHGQTAHPRNVPDAVLTRLRDNGGLVMVTFVPSFVSESLRQYEADRAAETARLESLHIGTPDRVADALDAWDAAHPRPDATVLDVADHIDHIRDHAGIDHIGLGGDFDGISRVPVGLEDVACYPTLLGELLRRGYTPEAIKQIAGGNAMRVLRAAEAVSDRLRTTRSIDETLMVPAASETQDAGP